jgi:hypothetical protein
MATKTKLAQRNISVNNHWIGVGLVGDVGYIEITDNSIYPDNDSRAERKDLGYNRIMIPLMTRNQLKELKLAIEEVLKNSK